MSPDTSGDINPPIDDPEDEATFAELGEVIREFAGAPPPELIAAAKDLFTWRTIDAELALLTFDSLVDEPSNAVRSTTDVPRVLTFEAGGLTVELEVEAPPTGRRLSGQLVPPQAAEVQASAGQYVRHVGADRFGRFVVPLPDRPGRVDLRVDRPGGPTVSVHAFL